MPTSWSRRSDRSRASAARHLEVRPDPFGDLVADGEHRIERRHRILEDHADAPAANAAERLALEREHVGIAEADARCRRRSAPGDGTSRSSARLVRLLPQPDSPTSASVSPRSSEKLTPSTARNAAAAGSGKGDPEVLDVEDSAHAPRGSAASRSASPNRLAASTVDHDGEAGEDGRPRRRHQHRLGVEDHAAPRGGRRLDAESEEREAGLEQDHVAHAERRRDEQRPERVRQQVPEDNAPPRRPRAPRRPGRRPPRGAAAPRRAPAARCRTTRSMPMKRISTGERAAARRPPSTRSSRKSRGTASAPSTSRMSAASTPPPR